MNTWAHLKAEALRQASCHVFNPPATVGELASVRAELGDLPPGLAELLREFNGAELFVDAIPLVTFFSLSGQPHGLPAYTRKWRSTRPGDRRWVFGSTNYGGLFVLDQAGQVVEWDSSEQRWLGGACSCETFCARLLADGAAYLEGD